MTQEEIATKTKEVTDSLLTLTKDFTQEQWQDLSFGLIRIGEFMAQKSFPCPIAKQVQAVDYATAIISELGIPRTSFTLNDGVYYLPLWSDLQTILTKRGKWYNTNREDNPWVLDSHDCDNHAFKCSADVEYIFGINDITCDSGYMVWIDSSAKEHDDSHKFNIAVAIDENNEIKCYLYEAQENYWCKFENKKATRGNVTYQVNWIEAF